MTTFQSERNEANRYLPWDSFGPPRPRDGETRDQFLRRIANQADRNVAEFIYRYQTGRYSKTHERFIP